MKPWKEMGRNWKKMGESWEKRQGRWEELARMFRKRKLGRSEKNSNLPLFL